MIARDDPGALKTMVEENGLAFPILHDPEGETIKTYGLWNEGFTHGVVPHPTALVIDREGSVAWKRVDTDYRERPPAEDLVAAVRALAEPGD